jgi:putative resolvase
MPLSIGEVAEELGVSVKTVRRWADAGKIKTERTPTGHRRFYLSEVKRLYTSQQAIKKVDKRVTINYARVSSHDQKADLERQKQRLELFSTSQGWEFETVSDLGSGLNYNKKGLQTLIRRILRGEVERLVVTHKDRLLRFGAEIIFTICEECQTQVVVINQSEDKTFEQELVSDMIELITVFSARLYGSRSRKNKRLLDNVAKSVQEKKPDKTRR